MAEETPKSTSTGTKTAQRVITLDDIKYNPEGKTMAILSCISIVGLVMFFVEKNDLFVRYYAAQFMLFMALPLVFIVAGIIPVVNLVVACLSPVIGIGVLVIMIMGMVKASKGERFDIPVLSGVAIKLMNAV